MMICAPVAVLSIQHQLLVRAPSPKVLGATDPIIPE